MVLVNQIILPPKKMDFGNFSLVENLGTQDLLGYKEKGFCKEIKEFCMQTIKDGRKLSQIKTSGFLFIIFHPKILKLQSMSCFVCFQFWKQES